MAHRGGDAGVDRRDPLVHRLGDGTVGGVALAARAQLDQVHRLAGVEVERVADPVGEAERVGRVLAQAGVAQALVLAARHLQRPLELAADARLANLVGDPGAEIGAEPLPLAGQHPVALQIAEGAVVGDDLEAVAQRLEAAAGAVAPVGALAHQGRQQLGSLGAVEDVDAGEDLGLRRRWRPRTGRRRAGPLRSRRRGPARPRGRPRRRRGGRGRGGRPSPRSARGAAGSRRSTRRRARGARPARRSSASPAAARRGSSRRTARASGSGEDISRRISCS